MGIFLNFHPKSYFAATSCYFYMRRRTVRHFNDLGRDFGISTNFTTYSNGENREADFKNKCRTGKKFSGAHKCPEKSTRDFRR